MALNKQTVVAIACIKDNAGKILMQRRVDPDPSWAYGKWEFPGGGIEFGESPETAVRREVREEIGREVNIKRLIPFIWSVVRNGENKKSCHYLFLAYECRLNNGGTPVSGDAEVSEIEWFPKHKIQQLDTLPGTNELLEHV